MFQNKKANVHSLLPEYESLDCHSIKTSCRWLGHTILSWSRFMKQLKGARLFYAVTKEISSS